MKATDLHESHAGRTQGGVVSGHPGGRQKGISETTRNTAVAAETLHLESKLWVAEIGKQLHFVQELSCPYHGDCWPESPRPERAPC
jgi:hypothetical protein